MPAETLLLLNPRKRRRTKRKAARAGGTRRHRTAAQKAATRKLVAYMRARRKVRKNPKSTGAFHMKHKRVRRYRRNPASRHMALTTHSAMGIVKPAAAGAAGALAVNLVMNQISPHLPAAIMDGKMAYVTKSAVAILLGVFGSKLPGIRPYARNMAQGSLTVTLADLGKDLAAGSGINLSGVGYINPGWIASPRVAGGGTVPAALGRAGMYVNGPARAAAAARMNGMGQYLVRR